MVQRFELTSAHRFIREPPQGFSRRKLLLGAGLAATGMLAWRLVGATGQPRQAVFIARNQKYDGALVRTIRDGLLATGMEPGELAGRKVLLKPNMVEPTRDVPHMTTHPSVLLAVAEVFRGWNATVLVGEAPGHVRDTEMALVNSGIAEALDTASLDFADLNYEPTRFIENRGRMSKLAGFHFPQAVVEADLIVSLPKLKTHHWMGMTAAMKNMYGVLPGCMYGWPKNVLHHAGIPETVYDINASLPKTITIVDGIVCMEGDGPIMGNAKPMGLLLIGTNPTAVDATAARIMGLDPARISYLQFADGRLGPIDAASIDQRGEAYEPLVSPFEMLDRPHLQQLRLKPGMLTSQAGAGVTGYKGLRVKESV